MDLEPTFCFQQCGTTAHSAEQIYSMSFSPNGEHLLTGGSSGKLNIWNISGGLLQSMNLGSPVLSIHWADISVWQEAFLVGLQNGSVVLYLRPIPSYVALWRNFSFAWSKLSQLTFKPFLHGFQSAVPGPVESISFSDKCLTAVGGGLLLIWNVVASAPRLRASSVVFKIRLLQSPNMLLDIPNKAASLYRKQPHSVHICPKYNALMVSFVDPCKSIPNSVLLLYHLKSFKILRVIELNRRIGASAISKEQKYIASTNLVDGIDIFTLPDLTYYGSILQAVDPQNNLTLSLAFIDDEFIVCGGKGTIFFYQVSNLKLVSQLQGLSPMSTYRTVTASSFHQRIAGGSTDGRITLWAWENMSLKRSRYLTFFPMPSQGVLCISLVLMTSLYIPIFYVVMKLLAGQTL